MQINFDIVLKTDEGTDFLDEKGNPKPFTLKDCSRKALLSDLEEKLTGEQKQEDWLLARKLLKGGSISLKVEQISRIKKLIGLGFNKAVVGAAYEAIDGKEEDSKAS